MKKGFKGPHYSRADPTANRHSITTQSCIVAKQSLEILLGYVQLLRHSIHSQQVALLLAWCCCCWGIKGLFVLYVSACLASLASLPGCDLLCKWHCSSLCGCLVPEWLQNGPKWPTWVSEGIGFLLSSDRAPAFERGIIERLLCWGWVSPTRFF